jgi:hypothetical protein
VTELKGPAPDGRIRGGGVGRRTAQGLHADGVFLNFAGATGNFQLTDIAEKVLELFAAGKSLALLDLG